MFKEDKQLILDLWLPALQATRNLHDLQELEYDAKNEFVYAKFQGGTKVVNVAMDSGTAMMKDVLKCIA